MKNHIFCCLCALILWGGCATYRQDLPVNSCPEQELSNADYSRANDLQKALDTLVKSGVPGCVLAVYSEEGWWESAAGLAKIEDQTPMQVCHLQYLQSISKTYLAVAVLKLSESGRIDLDAPIGRYLPAKYGRYLVETEKITVRMLMNHTSGLPEYNFAPAYVSYLLQHPDYDFTSEDYLGYIKGKALDFTPGSRYSYRNTNYEVLALITDAITGDHAQFIAETIFKPLELKHTFYRNDPGYLTYPELVNGYWDRHGDGIVENVSQMQRTNVQSMIGDDGIVTTPLDAVKFLKGLVEGRLLAPSTLEEMKHWVHDSKGIPHYGLGLEYLSVGGQVGYGHSGGGLGAGCELYYFPEKHTYMFIGINLGTVTESPLHEAVGAGRQQIYEALFK